MLLPITSKLQKRERKNKEGVYRHTASKISKNQKFGFEEKASKIDIKK